MRHLACPAEASSELKRPSGEAGLPDSSAAWKGVCASGGHRPGGGGGVGLVAQSCLSATPWTVATRLLCPWGLVMRKPRLRELSYPLSDNPGKVVVFWVDGGGGGGLWRAWVESVEGAESENSLSVYVGAASYFSPSCLHRVQQPPRAPCLATFPPTMACREAPSLRVSFRYVLGSRPCAPSTPGQAPGQAGGRERERSQ